MDRAEFIMRLATHIFQKLPLLTKGLVAELVEDVADHTEYVSDCAKLRHNLKLPPGINAFAVALDTIQTRFVEPSDLLEYVSMVRLWAKNQDRARELAPLIADCVLIFWRKVGSQLWDEGLALDIARTFLDKTITMEGSLDRITNELVAEQRLDLMADGPVPEYMLRGGLLGNYPRQVSTKH